MLKGRGGDGREVGLRVREGRVGDGRAGEGRRRDGSGEKGEMRGWEAKGGRWKVTGWVWRREEDGRGPMLEFAQGLNNLKTVNECRLRESILMWRVGRCSRRPS